MTKPSFFSRLRSHAVALGGCASGVAMVEFAYSLPILLTFSLGGAELTNYSQVRLRVSQAALHVADNASRIGAGDVLAAKQISEAQINDLLIGVGLQAGELELFTNGRVIISSLEPVANPNPTGRYQIAWQRCRGDADYDPEYGDEGDTNLVGIGPTGAQVIAPEGGATMFVEVYYEYQPLILEVGSENNKLNFIKDYEIREVAAMTVRDSRDLTQIWNNENAPVATCT